MRGGATSTLVPSFSFRCARRDGGERRQRRRAARASRSRRARASRSPAPRSSRSGRRTARAPDRGPRGAEADARAEAQTARLHPPAAAGTTFELLPNERLSQSGTTRRTRPCSARRSRLASESSSAILARRWVNRGAGARRLRHRLRGRRPAGERGRGGARAAPGARPRRDDPAHRVGDGDDDRAAARPRPRADLHIGRRHVARRDPLARVRARLRDGRGARGADALDGARVEIGTDGTITRV